MLLMCCLVGELVLCSGQLLQVLEYLLLLLELVFGDCEVLQLLLMFWQCLGCEDEVCVCLDVVLEQYLQLYDLWLVCLVVEEVGSVIVVVMVECWMDVMLGYLLVLEVCLWLYDMVGEYVQVEVIVECIVSFELGCVSGEICLVEGLLQCDLVVVIVCVQVLIGMVLEGYCVDLCIWLGEIQDCVGQYEDVLQIWLVLQVDQVLQCLLLLLQVKVLLSWLDKGEIDGDVIFVLIFLWGVLGLGVECVVIGLVVVSLVLCSDCYIFNVFDDVFQNYYMLQDFVLGVLMLEWLVQCWCEQLLLCGVQDDVIIDWLLWWDNVLLWVLCLQLLQGCLLVVLCDLCDMLLDWVVYGVVVLLVMILLVEVSEWLVCVLVQVVVLYEDDLYLQVLLCIDQIGNDLQVMVDLLGCLFEWLMLLVVQLGVLCFLLGYWCNYCDVMSVVFVKFILIVVCLGYLEE